MNLNKLTFIISLQLAGLMIYASGIKLWNYSISKVGFDFFPFVEKYHVILFWSLMVIQGLLSGFLIFRKTRLLGSYGVFFLVSFLSTYLYLMLHYAPKVPCSCTGIISGVSWNGHLWFTIGIVFLAGVNIGFLPDYKAKQIS